MCMHTPLVLHIRGNSGASVLRNRQKNLVIAARVQNDSVRAAPQQISKRRKVVVATPIPIPYEVVVANWMADMFNGK